MCVCVSARGRCNGMSNSPRVYRSCANFIFFVWIIENDTKVFDKNQSLCTNCAHTTQDNEGKKLNFCDSPFSLFRCLRYNPGMCEPMSAYNVRSNHVWCQFICLIKMPSSILRVHFSLSRPLPLYHLFPPSPSLSPSLSITHENCFRLLFCANMRIQQLQRPQNKLQMFSVHFFCLLPLNANTNETNKTNLHSATHTKLVESIWIEHTHTHHNVAHAQNMWRGVFSSSFSFGSSPQIVAKSEEFDVMTSTCSVRFTEFVVYDSFIYPISPFAPSVIAIDSYMHCGNAQCRMN